MKRKTYKPGDLAKLIRRYWWEYDAMNRHPGAAEEDSSEFDALVSETLDRIPKSLIGVPALSQEDALAALEWLKTENDPRREHPGEEAYGSIIDAIREYVVRSMHQDESANVVPLKAAS